MARSMAPRLSGQARWKAGRTTDASDWETGVASVRAALTGSGRLETTPTAAAVLEPGRSEAPGAVVVTGARAARRDGTRTVRVAGSADNIGSAIRATKAAVQRPARSAADRRRKPTMVPQATPRRTRARTATSIMKVTMSTDLP